MTREQIVELAKSVRQGSATPSCPIPFSYVQAACVLAEYVIALQDNLPGWTCPVCRAFNGTAKEQLTVCRACGITHGRPTI